MNLIQRLSIAYDISKRLDTVDYVVSKMEKMGAVIDRLERVEKSLGDGLVLESLACRLEALDASVRKIETLALPVENVTRGTLPVVAQSPIKEDLMEWNRLKLLSKFVQLADKGREIELEWQRIQQDEHDYEFAFKTSPNEEARDRYLFKKGIAEGVKWVVNRFS